ncbi:DMT family transporter [Vibrio sinaloensis]|uniref:Multidrug transporter n=1 Tax=Photobacterium sp. (strain ATCC 43367) TaxID=379097 RepID=A0A0A5I297_PHOS4|nr:DMT family transporter [Vibrio sinaloensis]KGY09889.1 multidrug transporter [Vibrio sinaloensis]
MNILLAMIPAFFWGTTYAVTQYTLADWPPLLLGAIRALPAGLLLLAFKPSLPKAQDWGVLVRLGFINIATFFVLIFVMALTLPSAISGVGMISVPVFAMLYTWLRYKKRPGRLQAVCGAALIALAWMLFDPRSISLNPVGLAAMLGAISCIIVGSSLTKSLGERIHWWTVLSWQLILGGVILTLAAIIHSMIQPAQYAAAIEQLSMTNVLGLLWVVLLNTALGYGLYVWLLQRMSVVDFTFGGIANPVAGIVSGLLLLGESFTPVQYSLMVGMIAMSLFPQVVDSLRSQAKAQTHAQIN